MKRQHNSKAAGIAGPWKRKNDRRERSRRLSDEMFRVFIDAVEDRAIYTMSPSGVITSWNQGAERLKGYTAPEILGRHYSCFFAPEDRKQHKPEKALQIAARTGRFEEECWLLRKDGSRFRASTVLNAIKNPEGRLIGFAKITRDITSSSKAEDQLRNANAELSAEIEKRQESDRKLARSESSLRDLTLRLMRAQDEERRRIGRELHDSVAQYLSMLKMRLQELDLSPGRSPGQLAAQIGQCVHLAEDALKEVRTVSHLLYPPALDHMGLKGAIPWYLEGFSRRSDIYATLEIDADFPRLDADIEIALFRVLQEALNNIHRHSGSNKAFIRLYAPEGHVSLEIGDSGRGIPPEVLDQWSRDWLGAQGVGLRGMRERMRQLGGELTITSDTHGTEVRATVPLTTAAAHP
jgi:PAS domain S-box-containing protein